MIALLLYGVTLLVAALLAEHEENSAFSSSVLFLAVGFLASGLGGVTLPRGSSLVHEAANIALVVVLLSDGMRSNAQALRRGWRLPARALLVGLPITFVVLALLAHFVVGLEWVPSLLVGAMLTPTDPVFAAALVDRSEVHPSLRHLLNIESGFNDGLALPILIGVLAWTGDSQRGVWELILGVPGGAAIGFAVPWVARKLRALPVWDVRGIHGTLFVVAIGTTAYACAELTHSNGYIASFCAGIAVKTYAPDLARDFVPAGEWSSRLLKFATLLVFALVVSPAPLLDAGWRSWLFVAGVLLVARPVGVLLALLGSGLPGRERLAAAWFGPKGFASVVYAFIVMRSGYAQRGLLFELAAAVVTVSIVLHSSTDVPVARWLARGRREGDAGHHERPGTS